MSGFFNKNRNEIFVGLLVVSALVIGLYLTARVSNIKDLAAMRVTLVLPDAAGLKSDLEVRVAGVRVGSVGGMEVEFDRARVTLYISHDAELRKDVEARVRAKSLLGEKFVDLRPVSRDAPLLEDGDTIVSDHVPVEPGDIFNQLGAVLDSLDAERLEQLLQTLDRFLAEGPDGTLARLDRLLSKIEELVPEVRGELLSTLGETRQTLTVARETLEPLHERREAIGRLVGDAERLTASLRKELPPTLAETRETLKVAREVAQTAGPTLEELQALSVITREQMAKISPLLDQMQGMTRESVRKFLREEGVLIHLY